MATTESPESPKTDLVEDELAQQFVKRFKGDPELEKLPLPNSWYKKFEIKAPRAVSFQEFALNRPWLEHKFDSDVIYEIREVAEPGGIRPIIESEPIPVEIITKPVAESVSENPPKSPEGSEDAKESSETEHQQS